MPRKDHGNQANGLRLGNEATLNGGFPSRNVFLHLSRAQ
jgi:hypothetical protein